MGGAPALAAAPQPPAPLASPALEARAQGIGRTLRCPVCQGVPITESTSDLSHQMLRDLREQVAAGQSDGQILGYFASRYGDTVLLDPPRRGAGLLLWLGPLAALLLGGGWLAGFLRRGRREAPVSPAEDLPADFADDPDPYLRRVRAETAQVTGSRPTGERP